MGFLVIGASIGLACVGKYLYDKLLDYNIDNYVLKLLNILTIN